MGKSMKLVAVLVLLAIGGVNIVGDALTAWTSGQVHNIQDLQPVLTQSVLHGTSIPAWVLLIGIIIILVI